MSHLPPDSGDDSPDEMQPALPEDPGDAEVIAQVRTALSQAGSVKGAARILGVDPSKVKGMIKLYPSLKAYLPNATPPKESELVPAVKLPAVATVEPSIPGGESEVAVAMEKANEQVRAGLLAMGVKPEQVGEVVAMSQFSKVNFSSMLHMVNGGMASLFVGLMEEAKALNREIAEGKFRDPDEEPDESGTLVTVELEKMLREDRSRLVKHLIDIATFTREASLTSAKIAQLQAGGGGDKKKRGKPQLGTPPLEQQPVRMRTTGPAEITIGGAQQRS